MSSIQLALKFINEARKNDEIRKQIEYLQKPSSLMDLIKIAENHGFNLNIKDLKSAFKYDWEMRWHRYNSNA